MATNYYCDAQGRYYSGTSATSANDAQLGVTSSGQSAPAGISTIGAAAISATPASATTVYLACKTAAESVGKPIMRLH